MSAYEFDIAAGYEAAQLCFQALAWRKRKELCRPLDTEENDERQPVAGLQAIVPREADRLVGDRQGLLEDQAQPGDSQAVALAAAIRALPTERQEFMKQRWPADLPGPKAVVEQRATWNFVQITQIWTLLQQANWACDETPEEEAVRWANQRTAWEERFGTSKPVAGAEEGHEEKQPPALDRGIHPTPQRADAQAHADEASGKADPDAVAALVAQLKALDKERTKITSAWVSQADRAGVPFGQITTNPTRRRFAIARAALALAEHMDGDDELVRMALALVLGDDAVQPAFTTGALLGSLHPEEADRLADVALGFNERPCRYCVRFDEDGVGRMEMFSDADV